MAAAATIAPSINPLTCSPIPRHGGVSVFPRRVKFTRGFGLTRQRTRKGALGVITAALELKPPPYSLDALEPHMSRETLEYHWGKHHRSYVENLNKQIEETELDNMPLEDIILTAYNKGDMLPYFNNAALAWNHQFFWESMKPGGGGKPSGELLRLLERDFGSFETFVEVFKATAATQFASGWAWLVYKANKLQVENAVHPCPSEEDKKLVVVKSPDALNPLVWDYSPLLTIDVWEHAYYLDFENRRPDYISTFLEKLVSWEVVSTRLEVAQAKAIQREKEEEEERRRREEMKRRGEEEEEQEEEEEEEEEEEDDDDENEDEEQSNATVTEYVQIRKVAKTDDSDKD